MDKNPDSGNLKTITEIDRVIHEPARLLILSLLYIVESADFLFIMNQTGLTRGNLSSHISKLESADYIIVEKMFVKKIPRTLLKISEKGKNALQDYRNKMEHVLENLPD